MKRLLHSSVLVLTLAMAGFTEAQAQSWHSGIHFLVGLPQGDFKDQNDNTGYGISGQFGYAPSAAPYMIGLEAGYLIYGDQTRREPFSSTIPDVTVDVNTTNNIALVHLLMRGQRNHGALRPYVEGLVGLNYLFTRTEVQNRGNFNGEIASTTNFDDTAFSFGGGGGLMLRVHESIDRATGNSREFLIDLRARYLSGGEAEYLQEGSLRAVEGRVEYDAAKSKTDLLTIQIGLAYRF